MLVKKMLLRNGDVFTNASVINVDQYTILLYWSSMWVLVYKHAVVECEGIPAERFGKFGNSEFGQNNILTKWSVIKVPLVINMINGEITTSIWNAKNPFVVFLKKDLFINKESINYVIGPPIAINK